MPASTSPPSRASSACAGGADQGLDGREAHGREIGIIGLTTPLLPTISSPRNATVSDDLAATVDAEARRLDRRGVDTIILSSHLQGIPSERALVAQLRRVDAGIAGGTALPTATGRFPQIAGFSMVVDPAPAAGSRVRSSTLADGTPIVMNGAVVAGPPIDIGTTNFTANGGDGYPFTGLTAVPSTIPVSSRRSASWWPRTASTAAACYPVAGARRIDLTP